MEKIKYLMVRTIIKLIAFYRYFFSPLLGNCCRFYPNCSSYVQMAVENLGVFRGIWLAIRRLAKCHPWHPGGYDPIPTKQQR